jgi:putative hydrolase of the HAD superfamily
MIRAVIFDLDGTLFDRDSAVRNLCETQYVAFESELTVLARATFVSRLLELDGHGLGDKEMVYRSLALEFDLSAALAARLVEDFWGRYHRFCRPFPDALSTLEALRAHGKVIGLITNGRRVIQEGTIAALQIRPLLDAILISEAEGVRKPDRAVFERAAARLGVTPSECCHVGDHPDVDVAGARAAGMKAVWKRVSYWNRPSEVVPIIDTLSELLTNGHVVEE